MNCQQLRDRLLVADATEIHSMSDHLETCPACHRLAAVVLEGEADLHRALDAYDAVPFDDAWTRAASPEIARVGWWQHRALHTGLALAAAALVVAIGLSPLLPADWVESWSSGGIVNAYDTHDWDQVAADVDRAWEDTSVGLAVLLEDWKAIEAVPAEERARHIGDRFELAVRIGQFAQFAGRGTDEPLWVERDGVWHNAFWLEAIELDREADGVLFSRVPQGVGQRVAAEERLARVVPRVQFVLEMPWQALSEADWAVLAQELWALQDEGVEADLRLHYELLLAIGKAAENANDASEPMYSPVAGRTVNTGWYRAAGLAVDRPELLATTAIEGLRRSVQSYVDAIREGSLPRP